MREAVSGRYGGVGLVIAGSKVGGGSGSKPAAADASSSSPPSVAQPAEKETKDGKEEGETKGPVGSKSSDGGEEGKKAAVAAAAVEGGGGGSFRDGITVVSAFEGCVYTCLRVSLTCVWFEDLVGRKHGTRPLPDSNIALPTHTKTPTPPTDMHTTISTQHNAPHKNTNNTTIRYAYELIPTQHNPSPPTHTKTPPQTPDMPMTPACASGTDCWPWTASL